MPVGELLPHVPGNLVVVAVYLVTHQHPQHLHTAELSTMDQSEWRVTRQQPMRAHLGAGVLLDLPQPVRAAVEGGLVGHVVHEDQGVGGPVVGLQYGNVNIQELHVFGRDRFYIHINVFVQRESI